ncbi:adenylate/guanylate cyclase domain-containing protein [Massilia sp. KIM]|uniref:CHASE2 domain-containing protein n=1 Tax=Massilia sp. KIM TaxID=1955422 RepID=UPI00098F26AF|nr:adenylate/guanylate cyclase domain-containing protein [Massilia sp. KIM]OON60762.1 adenylate/guanylate cyclase domain-containing protein [Massilia sp. KIM]
MTIRSFRVPHGVVQALISILAFLLCVYSQTSAGAWAFGNEQLRDLFLRLQVSSAPEPRVVVVDIDESSTARLGPWPWPRTRVADLVETLLADYGVRGVALDIVFPDAADPEGDARLAALASHGPVVLAQAFDFQAGRASALRQGVLATGSAQPAPMQPAVHATGYIANHAGLARAPRVGNIGFVPDPDGVLRRIPLWTEFEGKTYPALALALVNCCSGARPLAPLDPSLRVGFGRDWPAYTVVTAAEVLGREYVRDDLAGRLVVIGSSSLGQGDRVATPLGNSRPGLGVQAAVLSTLLDQQQGKAPARWPGAALALAFSAACVLFATFAFPRLSALTSVGLLALASVAWVGFAGVAAAHDPAFSTTGPLAANLFLLAFAVPYQWWVSQHRSRHLLDTLRQYVAPAVVQELLRSELADPLKPRQLDITTLIADMEGYTSQVENLSMEEAARLTQDFLDCLTGPVFAHNGTLDKYTGDGLVAFWGAPLPMSDHADRALDAAREIVTRVARLSALREREGRPRLRVRIGIESGPAMAGDFGTSFRSVYTAVGDSVNTASRLEQAARDFPHDAIVGQGTVTRATRHAFVPLGERVLRGKGKPSTLYALAEAA